MSTFSPLSAVVAPSFAAALSTLAASEGDVSLGLLPEDVEDPEHPNREAVNRNITNNEAMVFFIQLHSFLKLITFKLIAKYKYLYN